MLQTTEKTLDLVAILLEPTVNLARGVAVLSTRNHRLRLHRLNIGHQGTAVIGFVSQHGLDLVFVVGAQERLSLRAITGLARRQDEP